ncbi:DNA polymerase delta subunit 4 [Cryptosporidium sp. chipmunk genotype I]|uniref:DNA polymerase delta subunit 4 n=1 Tax=Cryptosporidium sp. chipmunk genotype I TaxID=1280935 RepID=UPI00351A1B90|nr:DNA polymerase delta subunit 4 [Cryptosporidium sp. chipmunk genotype I]
MPPSVNKKRKRPSKGLKEDGKENQSKLVGFKTSIVRPIVDPELETPDLKPVKSANDDKKLLNTFYSFDLDHNFGPCSEISRFQRLERAKKLGIPIDLNIEKLINDHTGDSNSEISISIIDKLMKHYAD